MTENQQLLEYVGETKTKNLMDSITKDYFELKKKTFPNSKYDIADLALITVTEPKETEILSIGHSCVNDLLTENFLLWLRGILTGSGTQTFVDINGVNHTLQFNAVVSNWWGFANATGAIGTRIQVGSGSATPDFLDTQIQTPFAASPENNLAATTNGVYFTGVSQAKCSAVYSPTTNAGTVRESAFLGSWKDTINGVGNFMLTHDKIAPAVNFAAGQSINIDYIFQI